MKKTLITLLALCGAASAADKVQIDFGRYDEQTEGYYNIYIAQGYDKSEQTANYVNGATSTITTHNLTLGEQSITLTYQHTSGDGNCGGKGLMPTLLPGEEADWKNAYSGNLPSDVLGNVSDAITTQRASDGGSHTLTFSNLAAGTYTFSAFGGFYGKDAFSAITVTLSDVLTADWSYQACETGTWTTNYTITDANSVTLNSSVAGGPDATSCNHGYYFTAEGITVEEGASLSVTIAGAGGYARTPLNYVSLQMVPEPTTATLSLLALAGLAARRRRR